MRIDVWVQHSTRTVLVTDVGLPPLDCAGDHWEFTDWWDAKAIADEEAMKLGYRVITHSVQYDFDDDYDPSDDGYDDE